ncbi:MAG: hypothetical protein K2I56_11055, partial [Muribaculaceae bacterium]|nr:hypothetical protein [Muribaculaceae bacterium]
NSISCIHRLSMEDVAYILSKADYRVLLVKADHGYRGTDSALGGFVVECVKSNFGTQRFIPMSGRRVVERINAWLDNFRRLCRNYERYLSTAHAMAYMASILFMLRYTR